MSELGWVVEGMIPRGAVTTFADLDDPPPETLLAQGYDAVIHLGCRGILDAGSEFVVTPHLHPRFGEPLAPFRVRYEPGNPKDPFVRVEETA